MKTIGFDLRPLQSGFKAHKERGIGVYTKNLFDRFSMAPADLSIVGFHDPYYGRCAPGSLEFKMGSLSRILRPRLKEYFNQHLLMRKAIDRSLKSANVERIFFPTHLDAPAGLQTPYAVTAHDMIQSALMNRYYNTFKHKIHIAKQVEVLKGAGLIIAVSHFTKKDVVKHAGVDPGRVVVVHNGVAPDFKPGARGATGRFSLPEKFILNVGGIDKRKNMELLFDSFKSLLDIDPDFHLVITGAIEADPQYQKFLNALDGRSLASRAIAPGYVTKEDLVMLYNRATVFVYPSLYEGFGLPILEAMACGAPVISTNRSSIPEVAGDAALLLDPDEPEAFAEAVTTIARSVEEREKMSRAGIKRAAQFSWDICAKKTWEALSAM